RSLCTKSDEVKLAEEASKRYGSPGPTIFSKVIDKSIPADIIYEDDKALLCRIGLIFGYGQSSWVLKNVVPRYLELLSLSTGAPADVYWLVVCLLQSTTGSLVLLQLEADFLSPQHQVLQLVRVGHFIIVCHETQHHCVVHKVSDGVGATNGHTVVGLQKVLD
ncbi:hypothetical protein GOODEAATRI_007842, partial [Goodea atripinnis]